MLVLNWNLAITMRSLKEARIVYSKCSKKLHFVEVHVDEASGMITPTIENICRFVDKANRILNRTPDRVVIVCVPEDRPDILYAASIAMGALMILALDKSFEEAFEAFKNIRDHTNAGSDNSWTKDSKHPSIEDCWRALLMAKSLGWIDRSRRICTKSSLTRGTLDIDQYEHYSRTWNGGLHTIIPGKLIVFPDPEDLSEGQLWVDKSDGSRSFSPNFYADLFQELNVSVAVCLGKCSFDASTFSDYGVEVEELGVGSDDEVLQTLRAMDRLLTLTRAAPGTIALHGGGSARLLGAFVAACLSTCHRFDGAAAVAWIAMTCPAAADGADAADGCKDTADLLRRHRLRQSASSLAAEFDNDADFGRSNSAHDAPFPPSPPASASPADGADGAAARPAEDGLAGRFLLRTCSAPGL
jgi:hypothetical protein